MKSWISQVILLIFLLIFLSCEDRIFLNRDAELILSDGVYTLENEIYSFDHVILENDTMLYTAFSCGQDNTISFFNIEASGTYQMSLIFGNDTVFSRSIYLSEIHNSTAEITILDVSQGDCIIISPMNEESSIVDGGYGALGTYNWQDGGNATLINYLTGKGETEIKYIIETHHHEDHYGGLSDIVADSSFSYDKYLTYDSPLPQVNDTLFFSEDIFAIMLHYGDIPIIGETEENSKSITFKLVYNNFEMLLTGDIELEAEEYLLTQDYFLQNKDYDILKVAHHGSSSSSTEAFLEQVSPKLSVISVGEGNPWDHPTEDTLEKLKKNSNSILRTDLNGTIRIFTDGIFCQTSSKK